MVDAVNETVELQAPVPFSQSLMWGMMREYYMGLGVDAWASCVPFYVTSNPYLARSYVRMLLACIQDWLSLDETNQPFYILELAAGSGQLGFYVLTYLRQEMLVLGLDLGLLRYVMTDLCPRNVENWRSHEQLSEFVAMGWLDFAVYDLEANGDLELLESGERLGVGACDRPLLVLGNYIFDSVPNDIFRVSEGKLLSVDMSLTTAQDNMEDGSPKDWAKIARIPLEREVVGNYYGDDDLDAVLSSCALALQDTYFWFPVVAMRALRHLSVLSSGRLMLISGDKGYASDSLMDGLGLPSLAFHGSFSVMVNYCAISRFLQRLSGECILQSPRKGLTALAAGLGVSFSPLLRHILHKEVMGFSAADYFTLYRGVELAHASMPVESVVANLALAGWDPYLFNKVYMDLAKRLPRSDEKTKTYFLAHLYDLAGNFYYVPKTHDTFFGLGMVCHELRRWGLALDYYRRALEIFGQSYSVLYNMGICLYYEGDEREAVVYFQLALEYKPDSADAKQWLSKLET